MKILNEEKAMGLFMQGNILGLEEIEKQLKEMKVAFKKEQEKYINNYFKKLDKINMFLELEDKITKIEKALYLLDYAKRTNYLLVETEIENYASDFNEKAKALDNQVLNELFNILEIDIEYYWNK